MSEGEERLDREALASQIDQKVDEFADLVAKTKNIDAPEAVGDWSLRDMLAHIVAWHEECLWAIRSTIEGSYERRNYQDVNGWNANALARYEGISGTELLERARSTGHEVASNLREVPEELWVAKRRLETWPLESTIRHYQEHEEDVRQAIG